MNKSRTLFSKLNPNLVVHRLGLQLYIKVYKLQKKLVNLKLNGDLTDYLLFAQHHTVITIGRTGDKKNVLVPPSPDSTEDHFDNRVLISTGRKSGNTYLKKSNTKIAQKIEKNQSFVKTIEIERGGDVTVHFPGQLIIYPILDLTRFGKDLHKYIRFLEQVVINMLTKYKINGYRRISYTGVWVGDKKIASIGIAARQWIAYHGISVNVSGDLKLFGLVNPCGFSSKQMTSMSVLLNHEILVSEVQNVVESVFKKYYNNIV